jgi:hypothetical protein
MSVPTPKLDRTAITELRLQLLANGYPPALVSGDKSGRTHTDAVRKFNADVRLFPGGPAMMELILLREDQMPRTREAAQRGDSRAANLVWAADQTLARCVTAPAGEERLCTTCDAVFDATHAPKALAIVLALKGESAVATALCARCSARPDEEVLKDVMDKLVKIGWRGLRVVEEGP